MNGDDERDYDEEAAVQRDAEVEGLAELAAEQVAMEQAAEQQDEHAREVAERREQLAVHDYGPLQSFEITWTGGHVERIRAHQVTQPGNAAILFGAEPAGESVIEFHGWFDGHWRLVLRVQAKEIRIVRNLSVTEPEVLG